MRGNGTPERSVPLERLFVALPALPETFVIDTYPGGIRWQAIRWSELTTSGTLPRSDCDEFPEIYRRWNSDADLVADVRICAFSTPRAAAIGFRFPISDMFYYEPNFGPPFRPSYEVYPPKEDFGKLSADQFDVACGEGSAQGICHGWSWRGRYGQYLVVGSLGSSIGGVGIPDFMVFVRSVDQHVRQELGRAYWPSGATARLPGG
jgi:hypothetical protein